jgi:sugar/nucleoside kinase (ribokinase family)
MGVICVGILVADVFAQPVSALPEAGELKTTDGFLLNAGGCAANVAVNLRRLEQDVSIVGKVGKDQIGQFVVDELRQRGIRTEGIKRSLGHPTSATVILNVQGEDRRYLHCIGANRDFCAADVSQEAFDGAQVLYVGGYLAMPGLTCPDLKMLFRRAKKAGLTTVLDVVIPVGNADAAGLVLPVLTHTDYFLPNNDEARILTGLEDPVKQAQALSRGDPSATVIVTLGPNGSVAVRGQRIIKTPAYKMQSIDESGAGDAFAAGLIVALMKTWPLEDALRFAAAIGASCTRAVGCSDGVFTIQEALSYIAKNEPAPPSSYSAS